MNEVMRARAWGRRKLPSHHDGRRSRTDHVSFWNRRSLLYLRAGKPYVSALPIVTASGRDLHRVGTHGPDVEARADDHPGSVKP